ncbi:MAG: (deoxy)nucleoside triphosphate pyrophosphohydrolase, partial [Oceanicoccus sp.]
EFPGGKIETGELPEACLARELQEELSVEADVGAFIGESLYDYGDKVVRLLAYEVSLVSGEPKLSDHDFIEWVDPSDLMVFELAPADIPLVGPILNHSFSPS